jgi:hypothetical protein
MPLLTSLISVSPITRIRRHHALEHATLQVLSKKNPSVSTMGYSDVRGFWIVGNVSTEMVRDAVEEALSRLRAGESQLAIHPNCGTNFVVTGLMTGGAAWLVMAFSQGSWRRRLDDFPLVVAVSALGAVLAQPLGMRLQARVTTDAHPGEMKVTEILIHHVRGVVMHRVITRHT